MEFFRPSVNGEVIPIGNQTNTTNVNNKPITINLVFNGDQIFQGNGKEMFSQFMSNLNENFLDELSPLLAAKLGVQ